MDVTDSATAALTAAADDAIRALVVHLSKEPNLTTRYDYRIDIHTRDGGTYPLIYRTDNPPGDSPAPARGSPHRPETCSAAAGYGSVCGNAR